MMVEVQCSSCHTRYRIDEQVLPEGTPTFKCSRCGHVFSVEPRKTDQRAAEPAAAAEPTAAKPGTRSRVTSREATTTPVESPAVEPAATAPRDDEPGSSASVDTPDDIAPAASPPPATGAGSVVSKQSSTEKTAAKPAVEPKPTTAELMARTFPDEPAHSETGENLAFDFNDDAPLEDDRAVAKPLDLAAAPTESDAMGSAPPDSSRWQVGEDPQPEASPSADQFAIGAPPRRRRRSRATAIDDESEMLDEDAAPIYNHGVTRSARFFVALCFLVAAGFAGITLAIHTAPAAARDFLNRIPVFGARFVSPMVPARMVALRDVHAEYRRGRDGRLALVIEGNAENVGHAPLHTIRIVSRIWKPSGEGAGRRQIYCGNSLATRTIAQMTSHEIEFFQELPPPKAFTLESSAACPFVIVFVDPPAQLARFDLAVTEADVADADESGTPQG